MRKCLGVLLLLSSLLIIGGCAPKPQKDCGFVQNSYGERVSWKSDGPIKMYLHESVPEAFVPAIQAAAETWAKNSGHPLFQIITSPRVTGPIQPHQDGKNIIYYMDTWEETRSSEQARTSIYWSGDLIQEADMRINDKDFDFYWTGNGMEKSVSAVNIEALVLHELGHVLGLKHKDTDGSVMATYLASGADRTQLADTDVADLKCEY